MGTHGILPRGLRVELIDEEIIEMAPIGPPHAGILNRIDRLRVGLCEGRRAVVCPRHPLEIDDHNEPEPDLCLLRWRDNFYADRHPLPGDVLLLIEIADSSLQSQHHEVVAVRASRRAALPDRRRSRAFHPGIHAAGPNALSRTAVVARRRPAKSR
jgi:hypothetical protein